MLCSIHPTPDIVENLKENFGEKFSPESVASTATTLYSVLSSFAHGGSKTGKVYEVVLPIELNPQQRCLMEHICFSKSGLGLTKDNVVFMRHINPPSFVEMEENPSKVTVETAEMHESEEES